MTVTVTFKSVLKDHGSNAKEVAASYRKEISSTERKLEVKVEGQQADAIRAFVSKLNSLSHVLNESYPRILEEYSETILDYVSNLNALGFEDNVVKTKAEHIQQIKEWLSVTKAKEFLSEGDELSEVIKKASEALAMRPHSVDYSADPARYAYGVTRRLTDLGSNREETHNSLMSYFNTFKSKLDSAHSQLEGLKGSLKNAQFMSSLPVSDALTLISKNYLTKENMKFLDSIQDTSDGGALKVILSEMDYGEDKEKFFTDLGSVEGSNISNPMTDIIYARVNNEFSKVTDDNSTAMKNIRAFIYAIANQEQEHSGAYFEKLVYAGDRYATAIGITAKGLVPELPDTNASREEFEKYDRKMEEIFPQLQVFEGKLNKAGQLTALFEVLNVIGIGQHHKDLSRQGSVSKVDRSIYLDKLKWNDTGFTFQVEDKSHIFGGKDKATVTIYDTEKGTKMGGYEAQLDELKEKRKNAIQNFVADIGKSIAGRYVPGASQVIDLVSSAMEQDGSLSSAVSFGNDLGEKTFKDLYSESLSKTAGGASKLLSFYESLMGIEDEIEKVEKDQKITLFDNGGRSLTGVRGQSAKHSINYDLQSILKMDDLEKNGLRGYAYRNAGTTDIDRKKKMLVDFEQNLSDEFAAYQKSVPNQEKNPLIEGINSILNNKEDSVITKDVYQMLMGNSHKSLDEIGVDKVARGMKWMQDESSVSFKQVTPFKDKSGVYKEEIQSKKFEVEDYSGWGNNLRSLLWPY